MNNSSKQQIRNFLAARDRSVLPAAPLIAGDHAAALAGVPLKNVCTNGRSLGRALVETFYTYEHDLVIVFSDVTVEAEAMGADLEFPLEGAPYIIRLPQISRIEPKDPVKDGRMPEILHASEYCVKEIGNDVLVSTAVKDPFSLAVLLRGPEQFLSDCIKNPELNEEILEVTAENQTAYIKAVLQTGALPIIGSPYASGSLISPETFSRFAAPYMMQLIKIIRDAGQPVFIHICGDSGIILDRIMELGPDILSIDELDLARSAVEYQYKTVFLGNLPAQLILEGPPEEVSAGVKRLINSVPVPFIPGTGCDIPPKSPPDHVKAMVQAVRNFSRE